VAHQSLLGEERVSLSRQRQEKLCAGRSVGPDTSSRSGTRRSRGRRSNVAYECVIETEWRRSGCPAVPVRPAHDRVGVRTSRRGVAVTASLDISLSMCANRGGGNAWPAYAFALMFFQRIEDRVNVLPGMTPHRKHPAEACLVPARYIRPACSRASGSQHRRKHQAPSRATSPRSKIASNAPASAGRCRFRLQLQHWKAQCIDSRSLLACAGWDRDLDPLPANAPGK